MKIIKKLVNFFENKQKQAEIYKNFEVYTYTSWIDKLEYRKTKLIQWLQTKFYQLIHIFKKKEIGNIIYREKKLKVPLSYKFKKFLIWFNFRNEIGDRIITEDTVLDEIFESWSKSLLIWFFEVLISGSLIYLALLPFYSVPFNFILFQIYSLGILAYVITKIWQSIVKGLSQIRKVRVT